MTHDMNRIAGFALAALLSTSAHAAFDPYEGSDNSIPISAQRPAATSRTGHPAYGAHTVTYHPPQQMNIAPVQATYRSIPVQNPAPTQNISAAPAPITNNVTPAYIAPPPPVLSAAPAPEPIKIAPPPAAHTIPSAAAPDASLTQIHTAPAPRVISPANIPARAPSYVPAAIKTASALSENNYSIGIDGFRDVYEESSLKMKEQTKFVAVTGSYSHYFTPEYYGAIEGRASLGKNNYKSPSGIIRGVTQWEFENRLLAGYRVMAAGNSEWRFYTGLGTRYFVDRLKGEVTDTGALGYERRILQFYAPIGVNYTVPVGGLFLSPTVEIDPLLYGHVNSRLQNFGGPELNNTQRNGYGLRGEFMIGTLDERGNGWEAGPFIRYWHVGDSDKDFIPGGWGMEPKNTRLQYGASLRYLF
jgi:hypothetical protein